MTAASPRVAYASRFLAFPPRDGGAVRTYEIVRALREHGIDAILIAPRPASYSEGDTPEWVRLFDPAVTHFDRVRRKASAFRTGLPLSSSSGLSRTMGRHVAEARQEGRVIIVAAPAGLANEPRRDWSTTIVDSHDLALIRAERILATRRAARFEIRRAEQFEKKALRQARAYLVCSELERHTALDAVPSANVHVLANGVSDKLEPLPLPRAPRAYFVGKLDYPPNSEGLNWLAREIWPLVIDQLPEAELLVAGSGAMPHSVCAALRACRGVSLLGEVESVATLQREARLLVAPLLTGGGTRLKILEACASARAVVTTPIGSEGLDLPAFVPTSRLAIEFARATARRLTDDTLVEWERQALFEWVGDKRWTRIVGDALVPLLSRVQVVSA